MKENYKTNLNGITKIALCTALLSVSSMLVIPIPVGPAVLSLHTLVVNLIALIMKTKYAVGTVALYLVMGLMGLPVFAGAQAGPDKLFGPVGGFYFGFLVSVFVMSLLKGNKPDFKRYCFVTVFLGVPIQHIFAVLFMCFHNGFNITAAFISVSLPFIIGDVFKCIVSSICALKINKILPR